MRLSYSIVRQAARNEGLDLRPVVQGLYSVTQERKSGFVTLHTGRLAECSAYLCGRVQSNARELAQAVIAAATQPHDCPISKVLLLRRTAYHMACAMVRPV